MGRPIANGLLLLTAAQACHSVEEYLFGLYDRLPPAALLSDLASADRPRGFAAVNVLLVAAMISCWALPIRRDWPSAPPIAWFWLVLETGNALGHLLLALAAGGYFPGLATAPLLLAAAFYLGGELRGEASPPAIAQRSS